MRAVQHVAAQRRMWARTMAFQRTLVGALSVIRSQRREWIVLVANPRVLQ